jgi:hypothetical protein
MSPTANAQSNVTPSRRRALRRLLAGVWLVALVVAVLAARVFVRRHSDRPSVVSTGSSGDDLPSARGELYAFDPVVGVRPRRSLEIRFVIHPLHVAPTGGGRDKVTRRTDNLSLVRRDDVVELAPGPRVLLVGDSHLMGVVSNADNASDLLEGRLHADGLGGAAVYNGSCGFYSIYQDVLRMRTLRDALRPDLFLLVVFLGNDFIELEDLSVPHLDDALAERPADPHPPAETTSARIAWLGLPEEQLFWQGLNQACYLHLHPERFEPIAAKARRSLELLRDLARDSSADVLVTLLPSFDLVFPERVAALNERARQVQATDANGRLRARLLADAKALGLATVDPLDAFRADGREDLFATDYHIFLRGHVLLAAQIAPALEAALATRRR